jgi:hypothetical protein
MVFCIKMFEIKKDGGELVVGLLKKENRRGGRLSVRSSQIHL